MTVFGIAGLECLKRSWPLASLFSIFLLTIDTASNSCTRYALCYDSSLHDVCAHRPRVREHVVPSLEVGGWAGTYSGRTLPKRDENGDEGRTR